jgi:outer membrane cobalamin receptor
VLLVVRHPGYATVRRTVEVSPGRTARIRIELSPAPIPVAGVEVEVTAERSGVRLRPRSPSDVSLGDVLRRAPGVVVRRRGDAGEQTVSVRGSAADQVLVLVDGVPLNDPLTGAADVSLVPASSVEDVVVLAGARSAEWGPRAQAGVVLVETRRPSRGLELGGGLGSLGRSQVDLGMGGGRDDGNVVWAASALHERTQGSFEFELPPATGGGASRRTNADAERTVLTGTARGPAGEGSLSARLRVESVRRGLPGRSFAPSPRARQNDNRVQLSGAWDGSAEGIGVALTAWGALRRSHLFDPEPATGLPWDDRVRAWSGGVRLRGGVGEGTSRALRGGLDVRVQGVRADVLGDGAPGERIDGGAFVALSGNGKVWGVPVGFGGSGRIDRDRAEGGVVASHDVSLHARILPGLGLDVAHRSGFSPPTLSDQYFRAGVGVEPNPGLRGERVPSEVEVGASLGGRVGSARLSARAAAFRGDVRDMILWAPDFRFVWSPGNVDVERRGVEAQGSLALPLAGGSLRVGGSWAHARTTYADRPGDVQLQYRPRNTGTVELGWHHPRLRFAWDATYTGRRYPVPAPVNALPGFWALDLSAAGRLALDDWIVEPRIGVRRLLDARDSLIFGFPEPGRTLFFGLSLAFPDRSGEGVRASTP